MCSTAVRRLVSTLSLCLLLDGITAESSDASFVLQNTVVSSSDTPSFPPRWLNTTSSTANIERSASSLVTRGSALSLQSSDQQRSVSHSLTPTSIASTIVAAPAITSLNQNGTQNSTVNLEACYAQWNDYWSSSSMHIHGTPSSSPVSTYTDTFTDGGNPARTVTFSGVANTETLTLLNGGFTVATTTITYPAVVWTRTDTSEPLSSETWTFTDYTLIYPPSPTAPPCSPPTLLPDCQSTWENVITTQLNPSPLPPSDCDIYSGWSMDSQGIPSWSQPACASQYYSSSEAWQSSVYMAPKPACQAFSISGSLCQSVRDNWQLGQNGMFAPSYSPTWRRQIFSHGSIWVPRITTADWEWYTSSTLGIASGCTLGCGRCEVTGGTVQLIYWPEPPQTSVPSQSLVSGAKKISRTPVMTGMVTAVTLGTTFTSPTLYISYAGVHAQDACSTVGASLNATILAIPTQSRLSSIYGNMQECGVIGGNTHVDIWTAPFTAADLNEPIPYSIYQSQPICQSFKANGYCNGTCATSAPYRPILVVADRVYRELQPAWADCWGDVHGVYDPPIALTGTSVAASITLTDDTNPTPIAASPSPPGLNRPATSTPAAAPTSAVQDLPQSRAPSQTTLTLPSTTITIARGTSNAIVLSAQGQVTTLSNDAVASIAGQRVSAASDGGVVLNPGPAAATVTFDPPTQTVATLGGQTITVHRADDPIGVVIAQGTTTTTLRPGMGAVTIAGERLSVAPGGTIMMAADSSTTTMTVPTTSSSIVVGGHAITIIADSAGAIVVDRSISKTLTAGATTTIEGQQMVIGSGAVVVGTGVPAITITLPGAQAGFATRIVGSQAAALSHSLEVLLVSGGSIVPTLPVGFVATIDGERVSVGSNGLVVVSGGVSGSTFSSVSPTASSGTRYTGEGVVQIPIRSLAVIAILAFAVPALAL